MSNSIYLNKVAILGAGVMGAQIAAHFANAHIPVILFDLKNNKDRPNTIIIYKQSLNKSLVNNLYCV